MSRSGYNEDIDCNWNFIRWRGAVKSALRGKRGQAFLREAKAALEALPERKLVKNELAEDGGFCTLGAVGHARGMDLSKLDPDDERRVAYFFGLPRALACEIMFENDEAGPWKETPEQRWDRMHKWIVSHIIPEETA